MIRELEQFELDAMRDYAIERGRTWKTALKIDWYNARAIGDRGAILHALRNDPRFGHKGLEKIRLWGGR